MDIPIIRGAGLKAHSPEAIESEKYESGSADEDARAVAGSHEEPWLNVLEQFEPGSPPALDYVIAHPELGPRVRGKVVDFGAGTCWVTARLSRLASIDEVVALDLSERFMTTVGARIIQQTGGNASKIRFAVSSFNETPFSDGSFDCGFYVASLHHSVSPIVSLMEARRILKPGGTIVLIETAISLREIEAVRRQAIEESRTTRTTEMRYTRGEWQYLLEHAGFSDVRVDVLDVLTRRRPVLLARRLLRRFDLERLIFTNLVVISARS